MGILDILYEGLLKSSKPRQAEVGKVKQFFITFQYTGP